MGLCAPLQGDAPAPCHHHSQLNPPCCSHPPAFFATGSIQPVVTPVSRFMGALPAETPEACAGLAAIPAEGLTDAGPPVASHPVAFAILRV